MESQKTADGWRPAKATWFPSTRWRWSFAECFWATLRKALPRQHVPHSVWTKSWVVYCKPAVQGSERVLQYLARYVHRIALANSRLSPHRRRSGDVPLSSPQTAPMEDDDPAGNGVHPAISAARAAPRNSQGAVLRVLESVPPRFAAPDPTGDGAWPTPGCDRRRGRNVGGRDTRHIVRDAAEVPALRRRDADPRRDHPPTHPSATVTPISVLTHSLIRRPTPMGLIVCAQPQRCPIGALSSTIRGPLWNCKQAPLLPARVAQRRLLALTH